MMPTITLPFAADTTRAWAITSPPIVLRLEAAALLAAAIAFYSYSGASWWLFAALFLVPDLAMLGYLRSPRFGAAAYNLAHSYALAGALAAWGLWSANSLVIDVATIWLAHIGFDRLLGYGLKQASGFNDTHLGRIGR